MLTTAQLATLKADIAANTNTIDFGGQTQIKNLPNTPDANFEIANQWYNKFPAVDFYGNYRNVPLDTVKNAVLYKNFTPVDAVPASGSTVQITNDLLNHLARTMLAQSFQINLNNLLTAGTTIDATKANIVGSWKDTTNTNMPTGVSGAGQKGGWGTIQTILCRKGTNIEKLFADLAGGTGADNTHAATFVFEGQITGQDVTDARNS